MEIFFADYSFFNSFVCRERKIVSKNHFAFLHSSYPYFILRVNYFREYDDYEIGSEEWHYHYHYVDCIFFTNKQIVFFSISSIVLSYNTIFEIRINHPPSHVYNVLPSQTLHYIESVFTPGPLPGVRSGLTARRLFDLAMIKLGKLEPEILK